MGFKIAIALVLILFGASGILAQDGDLDITPKNCVALLKGQTCYQTVHIRFSTADAGEFCLIVDEQTEPLQCWNDSDFVEYSYRLASTQDVTFQMVDTLGHALATARVKVAWVHKQARKRNRWRLF